MTQEYVKSCPIPAPPKFEILKANSCNLLFALHDLQTKQRLCRYARSSDKAAEPDPFILPGVEPTIYSNYFAVAGKPENTELGRNELWGEEASLSFPRNEKSVLFIPISGLLFPPETLNKTLRKRD